MQSIRLVAGGSTFPSAHDLPLRLPQVTGCIDPEPFRAQARGDAPPAAERLAPSRGMRTLHLPTGGALPPSDEAAPSLLFVVSGTIEACTSNRGRLVLRPGDLVLADRFTFGAVVAQGDCRLIAVQVEPDWPDSQARPVDPASSHPREGLPCTVKRMVMTKDGRSAFRSFEALFGSPGLWSAVTQLVGFRFLGMVDTFIDWHPEVVNNLVIVLTGALELEVGGEGGGVQWFREGDVCLAEDRTGEGHIDRTHGLVRVCILVIADKDLWL